MEKDNRANENLENFLALGEAPNNSWDWDCRPGCNGSDSVGLPMLNAGDADDPPIENLLDDV